MAQLSGKTLSEDDLFDTASEALASGDPAKGLALLAPRMEQGTANPGLWHLHGLILRQLERRDEALRSLRRASGLAPGSAKIAHALARTLFEAGLPSLEAYARAVRLAPSDTEVLAGMTSACAAEGQAHGAIDGLEHLLEKSPQWVEGHCLLAKLRWAQGERDRFATSFEGAVAQQPQNLLLWREWLIALMHAEHWDEARRVIAKGRAEAGDNVIFGVNEAIIAAESGDSELAEQLFAPFADANDGPVQLRRVRHYLRWGRPEQADSIIANWTGRPEAFMFWPYASVAWRMLDDPRWEWLEGDERFIGVYDVADKLPPLGVLADKLRSLHSLRGQPLEQSLRGGTQTEGDIFMHVDPVLVQLREVMRATVKRHAAQLPEPDPNHPLLRTPRDPINFSGAWSVWLKTKGFHANHVHPAGWLSSALYVVLPSDLGKDQAGFLTFGDPTSPTMQIDMPPFRTVEPKPGRLALFPSYVWHGTRPFAEGERITVAFDVPVPQGR